MSAFYNEIEPHAAQWIRNLAAAGHLPAGDVDERSIADVQPGDLAGYRHVHLFAGIGGWGFAARLAGWPDDREIWSASCPCQPFSVAGKGEAANDPRNLWPHAFRLISARRPAFLVGEQVASKAGVAWFDGVRADLAGIGYACRGVVVPACAINAPHRRDRIGFVAHPKRDEQPREEPRGGEARRVGRIEQPVAWDCGVPAALARFRALDDGISRCVEGTDAARNAIVPALWAEMIAAYLDTEAA